MNQSDLQEQPKPQTAKQMEILIEQCKKRQDRQLNSSDFSEIAAIIKQETGIIIAMQEVRNMFKDIKINKESSEDAKQIISQKKMNIEKMIPQDQQKHQHKQIFKSFQNGERIQTNRKQSESNQIMQPFPSSNGPSVSGQKLSIDKNPNLLWLLKSQRKQSTISETKSKRKVKLTQIVQIQNSISLQQRFQFIQSLNNDCHQGVDKKAKSKNSKDYVNMSQNGLWFFHQYFYSNYDKHFYQNNQMENLFQALSKDKIMKFKQFKLFQRALKKPKVFNQQFINLEIQNLNKSRKLIRQAMRQRQTKQEKYSDISQLTANKSVIALHPVCGHLHSGSILAIYKQNQHVVKFNKPQLGTQKIFDQLISSQILSSKNNNEKVEPVERQKEYDEIVENIDYQLMAITIKMLQYKKVLIKKLWEYNNKAQKIQENGGTLDYQFLQEYGWIGTTINIVSMALRHIITKFRLRGLSKNNQEQVGKNFTSLLLNPLHIMGKDLEHSSQLGDQNTSKYVRSMINQNKQLSIADTVDNLYQKNKEYMSQNLKQSEQRQRIQKLIKSCTGILANLKLQGKQLVLSQNKYMNYLAQLSQGENNELFNQIYDKLHSIVRKIKQL